MRLRILTALAASAILAPLAAAQGDITHAQLDSARTAVESARKQTVARNMNFSDSTATKFWPVYDAYRGEMAKIRRREWEALHALVTAPDSLKNAQLDKALGSWLSARKAEQQLREDYVPKFRKVLTVRQVVRYFQIEHRLDLVLQLAVAEEIPLVQ